VHACAGLTAKEEWQQQLQLEKRLQTLENAKSLFESELEHMKR
jgi:hypothetical protein